MLHLVLHLCEDMQIFVTRIVSSLVQGRVKKLIPNPTPTEVLNLEHSEQVGS